MNNRSETAKSRASQGTVSEGSEAPSMGPSVKPSEKATPMTAMPRLRAEGELRSAMMAVERLTFPLLMPPITLEARKAAKLLEVAHTAYDMTRPVRDSSIVGRLPKQSETAPVSGARRNCRKEKTEPIRPPNRTLLYLFSAGILMAAANQSTPRCHEP